MRYAGQVEDEAAETATCALDGCDNPLPPPARDERGRLKGGKPTRYCGKAHADEASRRRRALESVGVDEPLHVLRELGGQTRDAMDAALRELAEIRRRWDEIDAGAVARSAKDRAETAEALLKVEQARRELDDAVRVRAEALSAAAKDQQRRKAAEEAAEQAIHEAEQVKKAAWAQTAEHERARGQAETRAAAAEQAQLDAVTRLEATRRELRELTERHQETQQALAQAFSAADRAEAAKTLAETKIASAEERARLAGEAARLAELSAQRALEDLAQARKETEAARNAQASSANESAQALARYNTAAQQLAGHEVTIRELTRQLHDARERERVLLENVVAHGKQVEGG